MRRPWFPFYVGDFVADTMTLTEEELGTYLRLLLAQFRSDRIPLAHATAYAKWDAVSRFFEYETVGPTTFVYSERMRQEIEKGKSVSRKNSENARKRWGLTDATAYANEHANAYARSHSQSQKEKRGIYEDLSQEGEAVETTSPPLSVPSERKALSQPTLGDRQPNTPRSEENGVTGILGRLDEEITDTTDGDRLAAEHAKWRKALDPKWRGQTDFLLRYGRMYQTLLNRGAVDAEEVRAALEYASGREYWASKMLTPESMLRERDGVTWLAACLAEANVAARGKPIRSEPNGKARPRNFAEVISMVEREAAGG